MKVPAFEVELRWSYIDNEADVSFAAISILPRLPLYVDRACAPGRTRPAVCTRAPIEQLAFTTDRAI